MDELTPKQKLYLQYAIVMIFLVVVFSLLGSLLKSSRLKKVEVEIKELQNRFEKDKEDFCTSKGDRFPSNIREEVKKECKEIIKNLKLTDEQALSIINKDSSYKLYELQIDKEWKQKN